MRATWTSWLIAVLLVPAAGAHSEGVHLVFEGRDADCPPGRSMCFDENTGNLTRMEPGREVEVTFTNVGSTRHMWMVTTSDRADASHRDTEHHAALAQIEDVMPGASGNTTFTVPRNSPGLYFWCGEPGHEALGMWMETTLSPTTEAARGTPLPMWVALAALAVAVSVGRRL